MQLVFVLSAAALLHLAASLSPIESSTAADICSPGIDYCADVETREECSRGPLYKEICRDICEKCKSTAGGSGGPDAATITGHGFPPLDATEKCPKGLNYSPDGCNTCECNPEDGITACTRKPCPNTNVPPPPG